MELSALKVMTMDPAILLSLINLKLRNTGGDFSQLCRRYDLNAESVEKRLSDYGYRYNRDVCQFR